MLAQWQEGRCGTPCSGVLLSAWRVASRAESQQVSTDPSGEWLDACFSEAPAFVAIGIHILQWMVLRALKANDL